MVEWQTMRDGAIAAADKEPLLAGLLDRLIVQNGADLRPILCAASTPPGVFWIPAWSFAQRNSRSKTAKQFCDRLQKKTNFFYEFT
jgi:hypothetical protein